MLTAFAATSAAAGTNLFLKFQDSNQSDIAKGGQIEIESYSWGTTHGGAASSEMVLKGSNIGQNSPVVAGDLNRDEPIKSAMPSADVKSPRDSASGLATGKRQHKPFTVTKELDRATPSLARPLDKGSIWVRVSSPWAGCRVGAHYPSLELGDGTKRYMLQDVIVSNCGGSSAQEEVAFYYNRIAFNYAQ